VDVSALDAIDVHTHVHRSVSPATLEAGQALEAMAAYFKTDATAYTVDELAQYYRDRNTAAVTFTVDVKFTRARRASFPTTAPLIESTAPHGGRHTSTCPAGHPSTSRPSWSRTPTFCSRTRVLSGTGFPMLTPHRWRADLDRTAIRDEIKPTLYKHHVARLLGLRG
jgi:hypothetical protein